MTDTFATLGEFVAWIIGWNLILEYAVGNIAVAVSWSGYFCGLLRGMGIDFPRYLATDLRTTLSTPGSWLGSALPSGWPPASSAISCMVAAPAAWPGED